MTVTKQTKKRTKIILPDDLNKLNRQEIINKFLKEWLTEKQQEGMGPWVGEMLDAFAIELLTNMRIVGVERLLTNITPRPLIFTNNCGETIRYPLLVVPQKPKKTKIDLEEIEGGLAADVNLLPVKKKE